MRRRTCHKDLYRRGLLLVFLCTALQPGHESHNCHREPPASSGPPIYGVLELSPMQCFRFAVLPFMFIAGHMIERTRYTVPARKWPCSSRLPMPVQKSSRKGQPGSQKTPCKKHKASKVAEHGGRLFSWLTSSYSCLCVDNWQQLCYRSKQRQHPRNQCGGKRRGEISCFLFCALRLGSTRPSQLPPPPVAGRLSLSWDPTTTLSNQAAMAPASP